MKKVLAMFLVAMFITLAFGAKKTEIKPQQLPQCLKDYVVKNYADYKIDKAYKMETTQNEVVITNYLARASKKDVHQWVLSDANCKDIKTLTQTQAEELIQPKPKQK